MDPILQTAYALQIDYIPENPDVDIINTAIEKLKRKAVTKDRVQWEQKIRAHRRAHRSVICHEPVTLITRKDIDLMSNAQLVYFPMMTKESVIYYPLDAVTDVDALLYLKKNPFTNETLSDQQIAFLNQAKENHKYPRIAVGDFFEEVDERLLSSSVRYSEKEYQRKMRELVSLIETTKIVVYESAQVYNFATDYILAQYNLFLRHKPINQVIPECSRDDASAKTLNHILNYLNLQHQLGPDHGKIATINMAYAIDEFVYLIRNSLTYDDLLRERGLANELYWKPNFIEETHYHNGNLKCQYYVDEERRKHGSYIEWYKNGNICYRSIFHHDVESNISRYYGTGRESCRK